MNQIKKLLPQEAQKIAAGEVVDRPANVVKELLENAIDAGSTKITLYVEDAGKQLIRVIDNGCGMNEEDAHFCFEHHATSKITTVNDLTTLETFGFRGEALSSIASVSNVTLITKDKHSQHGIKLELESTTVINEEPVSCNAGTDITIKNIFYNVPARKKFLKKRETEWRHIITLFHAFCLDYLSVHFTLFSEDNQIINCPAADTLDTRITQLWDHNIAQNIMHLASEEHKHCTITGIISNHQYYKYDRSSIFFFVNKRWVKNQQLSRALLKGYMNVLPHGQYPAACIFITLDPAHVDINIHPRKEEVSFLHPRVIESVLQQAVKQAHENYISQQLTKKNIVEPSAQQYPTQPIDSFHSNEPSRPLQSRSFSFQRNYDPIPSIVAKQTTDDTELQKPTTIIKPTNEELNQKAVFHHNETQNRIMDYSCLIGQYKKTYLLLEHDDGLLIIDQHAAHERILYESFVTRFKNIATVKLIFPIMVTVGKDDLALLEPYLSLLQHNGIEIEIFGTDQLIINATPVHLQHQPLDDLVRQAIGWIVDYQQLEKEQFTKKMHEKIRAQMACKAAVKAGDILTTEQMQQLIRDLSKTSNRLTCPHGRPTSWLLHNHEIEKKFKRDYKSPSNAQRNNDYFDKLR